MTLHPCQEMMRWPSWRVAQTAHEGTPEMQRFAAAELERRKYLDVHQPPGKPLAPPVNPSNRSC